MGKLTEITNSINILAEQDWPPKTSNYLEPGSPAWIKAREKAEAERLAREEELAKNPPQPPEIDYDALDAEKAKRAELQKNRLSMSAGGRGAKGTTGWQIRLNLDSLIKELPKQEIFQAIRARATS